MNTRFFLIAVILITGLIACDSGPQSPRGFSLPEGDIARGEVAFNKYQCLTCHSLDGYEQTAMEKTFEQPVRLGGESTKVKTYAELVTSIINPSHKIAPRPIKFDATIGEDGKSKMQVYNDVMTVSELIDIVAFLQPKYQVKPRQYTHYNVYHIP